MKAIFIFVISSIVVTTASAADTACRNALQPYVDRAARASTVSEWTRIGEDALSECLATCSTASANKCMDVYSKMSVNNQAFDLNQLQQMLKQIKYRHDSTQPVLVDHEDSFISI